MTKLILPIAFLVLSCYATAQSNDKIISEIKTLEQEEVTAILQGDTNKLKSTWAPEFLVNNPRNMISPDRNAVLTAQRSGLINYSVFERIIENVQVQKDVVITMGHELVVSKTDIPGGAKAGVQFKRRFTNIWMKQNGKWQQIARHASVICQ